MYHIKPSPKITHGAERAKKNRINSENKEERESKAREKFHNEQQQAAYDLIASNAKITEALEETAKSLNQALAGLSEKVSEISLDIPESTDGKEISGAIGQNTESIKQSLQNIEKSLSKIKLEVEPTDLKPHTEALEKSIASGVSELKKAIKTLTESVKAIEFEHPPLVLPSYKVIRDENGLIEEIYPVLENG